MDRRVFVKSGALALVTMGLSPRFLRRAVFNLNLPGAQRGKVLICIFQRGAADALNIVVPHGEQAYYGMRPSIAIPRPTGGGLGAGGTATGAVNSQTCVPCVASAAVKYRLLPTAVSAAGLEEAAPGLTSAASKVPAAVPLLSHSSVPVPSRLSVAWK